MFYKKSFGQLGENIALIYYQNLGYKLISKNYHSRYGEIDLVFKKDNQITVVEVKTRSNKKFVWAEESIDNKKINNIYQTYQKLSLEKNLPEFFILEALIIELAGQRAKIYRYQL